MKRKYSGEILTDFNMKDSLWRERYYSLLELNTCIKIGKIKCENIMIDWEEDANIKFKLWKITIDWEKNVDE